jgi:hypothetical protein
MMRSSKTTMTNTNRTKRLIKMLEKFLENDRLQEAEQVEEAKRELASLREQIEQVEKDNYKGFGKK